MTKNVKVRAILKGTLSFMADGGIKEEGQAKIHQDITLTNISYEDWMKRYDDAITVLKNGMSLRDEELVKSLKASEKRYNDVVAQLKFKATPVTTPAPKEVIISEKAEVTPKRSYYNPEPKAEVVAVKPAPKKKVASKKKSK